MNIPEDVTPNINEGFTSAQIVSMMTSGVFLNSCKEVHVEAAGDLDALEGHRWRVEGEGDWENDLGIHQ